MQKNSGVFFVCCLSVFCASGDLWGMDGAGSGGANTAFALTQEDESAVRNLRSALATITQYGASGSGSPSGAALRVSLPDGRDRHLFETLDESDASVAKAAQATLMACVHESVNQLSYLQQRLYPKDTVLTRGAASRALSALRETLAACRAQLDDLGATMAKVPYDERAQLYARNALFGVQESLAEFFAICAQQEVPYSLRLLQSEQTKKRQACVVYPEPQGYLPADSLILLCADLVQRYCANVKKEAVLHPACARFSSDVWCPACRAAKASADASNQESPLLKLETLLSSIQPVDQLRYLDARIGAVAQDIDRRVRRSLKEDKEKREEKKDAGAASSADLTLDASSGGDSASTREAQKKCAYENVVTALTLGRLFLAAKADWANTLKDLPKELSETIEQLLQAPLGQTKFAESMVCAENAGGWWWPVAWLVNRAVVGEKKKDIEDARAKLPKDMALAAVVAVVHHPVLEPLLKNKKHEILLGYIAQLAEYVAVQEDACKAVGELLAVSSRERTLGKPLSGYMRNLGYSWWPSAAIARPLGSESGDERDACDGAAALEGQPETAQAVASARRGTIYDFRQAVREYALTAHAQAEAGVVRPKIQATLIGALPRTPRGVSAPSTPAAGAERLE